MDEHKRIIEVNGVKVEVDLRTAKQVDTFRVGDRVKILVKKYSEDWRSYHGVIVAFDAFEKRPAIVVCYIGDNYDETLQFATITAGSDKYEIAACNDDVLIEKGEVIARINTEIDKKRAEIEDLERKRDYFIDRFGAWFKPHEGEEAVRQEAGAR